MNEKKQIEEMAKHLAEKICWDEDEIPTVNCLETATRLYIKGYRKQPEWISVEDRLPERCGYYLTYTTRETIEISRFYPFYVNDTPQFDYWITHWMPLPEAPKKGGAE